MTLLSRIWAVTLREFRLIKLRPIYLLATVAVMSFCSYFFLTIFMEGLPSDLPVAYVDEDLTYVSRRIGRELNNTQLVSVVKYDSYQEARRMLQRGKITAIFVVHKGFYDELLAYKRPHVDFYVNSLYFVGGSMSYKQLITLGNLLKGAVQREFMRAHGVPEYQIMGRIQPIVLDHHQIGNPRINYGVYLPSMLLPGVLQLIIILVIIYTFGAELKYGTSRELLECSNNNMFVAVTGKLLPYTILFMIMGLSLDVLLYKFLHFPMEGVFGNMCLAMMLLIFATESISLFFICLIPVLRDAVSCGALYSILGFSLAGFTLPVEVMIPHIQGLSWLYPLRHYFLFFVKESYYGTGIGGWYLQVICLMVFMIAPFFLFKRLKRAYINLDYPRK